MPAQQQASWPQSLLPFHHMDDLVGLHPACRRPKKEEERESKRSRMKVRVREEEDGLY